jgi:hypothetical protein
MAVQLPWLWTLTVVDMLTEVLIVSLPIIGLRSLQMPFKRRALVILAFSFRLPYVPPVPLPCPNLH